MTVDPTPPSRDLAEGSTEGVRGGTKTKFNMVALVGGLVLVIAAFIVIYLMGAGNRATTEANFGAEPSGQEAKFDTTIQPAKGDSPQDGDAVDPLNTRKDSPEDPTPTVGTAP